MKKRDDTRRNKDESKGGFLPAPPSGTQTSRAAVQKAAGLRSPVRTAQNAEWKRAEVTPKRVGGTMPRS